MFTHTLRTEKGTRATIEIPYSKLGIQEKTLEQKFGDDRLIILNHNHGQCRCSRAIAREQIQELEKSYDNDMRMYGNQIALLANELQECKRAKLELNNQMKQLQGTWDKQLAKWEADRKQLSLHISTQASQIAKMEVDRMFLYKLKVQESNNEADQHLKKVEAALEAVRKENKDLLKAIDDLKQGNSKLLASLESQTNKVSQLRIQWKDQVNELKLKIVQQNNNHAQFETVLVAKQLQIERIHTEKLDEVVLIKSQSAVTSEQLERLNVELNQKIRLIIEKEEELKGAKAEIKMLRAVFDEEKQKTLQLKNENANLNKEIQRLDAQYKKLNEQSEKKEKVYEVKIERVVDSSLQLSNLESQVTQLKKQLKEGSLEYSLLESELAKRRKELQATRKEAILLSQQVQQLKAYIDKKERSLAWIVQREVQKDRLVTNEQSSYRLVEIKQGVKQREGNRENYVSQIVAMSACKATEYLCNDCSS